MNDAIRKALKKQKELHLEIERLERFISTYEELSGEKIPRDEMTLSLDNGDKAPQISEQTEKQAPKRRNNLKKLIAVSERLINEAGRPLNRTELAEGMDRLKVVVHATDIPKYLGTLLWRNPDRFVSSDGDGYMTKRLHKKVLDIEEGARQDKERHEQRMLENQVGIGLNKRRDYSDL